MKVGELLASRRQLWKQLDDLCVQCESRSKRKKMSGRQLTEFGRLYRAACADLALAESYQLPPNTVAYLHRLVGRAHNQLYRAKSFNFAAWKEQLLVGIPRRLFTDGCLRLAFLLFWGVFLASYFLAVEYPLPWMNGPPIPGFAEQMLSESHIEYLDNSWADWHESAASDRVAMAGFYLYNNAGIGLTVFAMGLAFGIGGMFATVFNAAFLGAVFGYMARSPHADNFFNFVTAHGPVELTAIILAAGAGMRLGFAIIRTDGQTRIDSLRAAANDAMPTMGAALILFIVAALIEGFISPFLLPYAFKAFVAVATDAVLIFYFVLLGQRASDAESDSIETDFASDAPHPLAMPVQAAASPYN